MTTTTHRRDTLARIGNVRDTLAQAAAEGRVLRGEIPTWQENALERAGELALLGRLAESRRMAERAREDLPF